MKGIIKPAAGRGLMLKTNLEVPKPEADEVTFRVLAAAVCGSDLHIEDWNEWASLRVKPPMVIGHEVCGEITEVGDNVTSLKIGDIVSIESHIPCYDCETCKSGYPHICPYQDVYGVTVNGGFAEYSKVRHDVCVKLPDAFTPEMGALMEPMGAGVHGVSLGDVSDKTVLINGCGPIGLMSIGACLVKGAKEIIAVDIYDSKLELAKRMGADVVFNAQQGNLVEWIKERTNGLGVDVVLDYTGSGAAIVSGLRSARKGGTVVLVGLPDGEVSINLTEDLIYKELIVKGVSGRLMFETWDDCIEILTDDRFSIEPLIGGRFSLDEYEEAFSAARRGNPGKMILYPQKGKE